MGTTRKMMKTMRKKDDSYLCLAAWAEGKPGYRRVPFLSLQLSSLSSPLFSPLSSLPSQCSWPLSSLPLQLFIATITVIIVIIIVIIVIRFVIQNFSTWSFIISTIVTDQNCHHNWHHINVNGIIIIFYINDINIFIQILTVIVLRCEYSWKTSLLSLRNSTGSFFVLKISTRSTRGLNTCQQTLRNWTNSNQMLVEGFEAIQM